MSFSRRDFLIGSGIGLAGGAAGCSSSSKKSRASHDGEPPPPSHADAVAPAPLAHELSTWEGVRDQFALARDWIHMSAFRLVGHPRVVSDAIEAHRRGLDHNPYVYREAHADALIGNVISAAARYLDLPRENIALTDSTTFGNGILYNGLVLNKDHEILTTRHEHWATARALEHKARSSGAVVKTIALYEGQKSAEASADELVHNVVSAVTDRTRVLAMTWVHSETGLKLPIRRLADEVARINAPRALADRVLLCVDGVHGFGVDDATVRDLGCDFFSAGCHKWLFGPRGTGILYGHAAAWDRTDPDDRFVYAIRHHNENGIAGGIHAYEYRWALAQAFQFHLAAGPARVAARTRDLNRQAKEGLAKMKNVRLYTPMSEQLSAGMVCFEVEGLRSQHVAERLLAQKILASYTPYETGYARVTPSVLNSPQEVEATLRAIRALA